MVDYFKFLPDKVTRHSRNTNNKITYIIMMFKQTWTNMKIISDAVVSLLSQPTPYGLNAVLFALIFGSTSNNQVKLYVPKSF